MHRHRDQRKVQIKDGIAFDSIGFMAKGRKSRGSKSRMLCMALM